MKGKNNAFILAINKVLIPNDSILVNWRNDIGYSETRLGYAIIPVYCIGKNIKLEAIKKVIKLNL